MLQSVANHTAKVPILFPSSPHLDVVPVPPVWQGWGLGQSFARGPRGRDDMAGALVAQVVGAKKNRQGRRGRRNSKRRTGKVVACGGTSTSTRAWRA